MASLLVITGPPGAGKSTVASLVAAHHDRSVLVEGDAFFAFLDQGRIEPWLPASRTQNETVTDAAARATGSFVAGGYDTVYDGVIGPWFLPRFTAGTGLTELDYVILLPPLDTCWERVATRTGHGFRDRAATEKMHHEFTTAAAPGTPTGIAVTTITDAETGAETHADRILALMEAGALRYRLPEDEGP